MRALYTEASQASTAWPEPLEKAYQVQSRAAPRMPGARRPDITVAMRLLIGSVVQLGDSRPWGSISWLADVFQTSRQTVYAVGQSVGVLQVASDTGVAAPRTDRHGVSRHALTLLVAGCMRLRATQHCLAVLLGHHRTVGWLSGLVDEAGTRAGKVLEMTDWSGCRRLVVARDELYFSEMAFFLTVDTRSLSIVSQHVEDSACAANWGVSLALDHQRTGGKIVGIAEDAATYFPASIAAAADLLGEPWDPIVQKDVWHFSHHAGGVVAKADRIALAKLAAAEKIAHEVSPGCWRLANVRYDGKAEHAAAGLSIDHADVIRTAAGLLGPALAIVDQRTNAIMDRQTAVWYLKRIEEYMDQQGGPRGAELAGALRRQAANLLSFHMTLSEEIEPWRRLAMAHFGDVAVTDYFERQVARVWRMTRDQTNGRKSRTATAVAKGHLAALCHNDPAAADLAADLNEILEGVVRTSSAVECVNSILRGYLWGRRHFKCRRTAQNWLNLLVLWHNMRTFQRGKRVSASPFELAGVVVRGPDGQPTTDWLTALGYAEAA